MAAALLKQKTPEVHVRSAGIFAQAGQPASSQAIAALAERGIELKHVASPISEDLLEWSDLVLTMTTGHKQSLILQYPAFQEKYFTLKEYTAETDKKVWGEMKELQAKLEAERLGLSADAKMDLIKRIQHLESQLVDYDVQDPFGGSIKTYKNTLQELDQYLDILAEKMKKRH